MTLTLPLIFVTVNKKENATTDDQLYDAIWEVVGKHVGYGIECDVLTDQIWDIIMEEGND